MLLQSVLIGKAREVYSALSVEQSTDNDLVKSEISRAYELVPEAYRQKFRDTKCQEGKTYMEFARQKEALFNRWCTSQQVGNNCEKLNYLRNLRNVYPHLLKLTWKNKRLMIYRGLPFWLMTTCSHIRVYHRCLQLQLESTTDVCSYN